LIEMGYERNDALYALRITSNNLEHACTYLMNNPNPSRGMVINDISQNPSSRLAALETRRQDIEF
jgi:UBA/TS-N domain